MWEGVTSFTRKRDAMFAKIFFKNFKTNSQK